MAPQAPAAPEAPQKAPPPLPTGGNGHGDRAPRAMDEHAIPTDLPRPGDKAMALFAGVFALLLIVLFVIGWIPHHLRQNTAKADADEVAAQIPIVEVTYPIASASSKDLVLPASVQANQQTDIYPRATGYLKHWYVDIQDHVRAQQLLAEIDAPDVDAQYNEAQATLEQARATVNKAVSDVKLAQTTLNRYLDSQKTSPGSVTQQDVDQNEAAYEDAVSALAQARANVGAEEAAVQHLAVLQGFEKITAPFAGTITVRNYDVGALMNPSNTSPGTQIFSIVDASVMRVFVKVPQTDATLVKDGQPTTLTVYNYPGRDFHGTVARTSGAIDPVTRTLTLELHFPNADGALYAGMYGTVSLEVNEPDPVLLIPTSALIFNAGGLEVASVRGGAVHMVNDIKVGRDLGTQIEVTTGLSTSDQIITNPGDRVAEGVKVKIHTSSQTGPATRPAISPPTTKPSEG